MIPQLVRADPAWKLNTQMAAMGVLAGLLLPRQAIGMIAFLTWMPWLQCRPEEHAAPLHTALPVRARDLFLARLLALLLVMWLPLATCAAAFAVTGRPAADMVTLLELGAAASLVILMSQSPRVGQASGSEFAPAIVMVIITAVALPTVHFLEPPAILALCALLATGLFWNIWRQLPLAFEVLPSKEARGSAARPSLSLAAPPHARRFMPLAWLPLIRWAYGWRGIFPLMMIVMGLGGGEWLWAAIFCTVPAQTALRTPWPLGLPIRRGALLTIALAPWLLVLLLSLALAPNRQRGSIQFTRSETGRVSAFKLPLEYWRYGRTPEIQAPWGESSRPKTEHFLGVPVYNPFSFEPQNSPQFIEWQFQRATAAIYGQAIALDDYQAKRSTLPPLVGRAPFRALNVAACALWVLLLTNVLVGGMHWRVQRYAPFGQHVISVVFFLQMILIAVADFGSGSPWSGSARNVLIQAPLIRVAALLPGNAALAALIAVIPIACLCWSAARLMQGIEPPPPNALDTR
ncbi:MAG: hypothetical protein ABI759_18590 [Candidatus Solibacter sp.]